MDTNDIAILDRQFDNIGGKIKVELSPDRVLSYQDRLGPSYQEGYRLNIRQHKQSEVFTLTINENALNELELSVVNIQPETRHLLLMAKWTLPSGAHFFPAQTRLIKAKFLCGFDERHWFAAQLRASKVTDIWSAMESLKPEETKASQCRRSVRTQHWHRRHNAGFIRQGEWFFIPQPEFKPEKSAVIYSDESIRRGTGKPHWVDQLLRTRGETVYVRGTKVLTVPEYELLQKRSPTMKSHLWQQMRRGVKALVKGAIRHPDHATIVLPVWHLVVMNNEIPSINLAFLD